MTASVFCVTQNSHARGTGLNWMVSQQNYQQYAHPRMPVVPRPLYGFRRDMVSNLESKWKSRLVQRGLSEVVVFVVSGSCPCLCDIVVILKCIA